MGDGLLGCCAHPLGGDLRWEAQQAWALLVLLFCRSLSCRRKVATLMRTQAEPKTAVGDVCAPLDPAHPSALQAAGWLHKAGTEQVCWLVVAGTGSSSLTTKLSDTAGGMSARRCPDEGSSARSSSAKAAFLPDSSASLLPAEERGRRRASGWRGAPLSPPQLPAQSCGPFLWPPGLHSLQRPASCSDSCHR